MAARQRAFLVLGALSLVASLGSFLWRGQLEDHIRGAGVTAPDGILLLAPALQFLGGLSLLFLRQHPTLDERQAADSTATTQIANEVASGAFASRCLAASDIHAETLKRASEIVERLGQALKFARDMLGFGSLSVGFALGLLSLNSSWSVPVRVTSIVLLITGLVFLLAYSQWPRYLRTAKEWSEDVHANITWPQYLSKHFFN